MVKPKLLDQVRYAIRTRELYAACITDRLLKSSGSQLMVHLQLEFATLMERKQNREGG